MYSNFLNGVWSEADEAGDFSHFCGGWTPRQLSPWCGSGFSMPTLIDNRIALSGWNYALWMNSLLWALYCVIKQSLAGEGPQNSASHSFISRFASRWRSSMRQVDQSWPWRGRQRMCLLGSILHILVDGSWLPVLRLQLVLCSFSNRHYLVIWPDCRHNGLDSSYRTVHIPAKV